MLLQSQRMNETKCTCGKLHYIHTWTRLSWTIKNMYCPLKTKACNVCDSLPGILAALTKYWTISFRGFLNILYSHIY